MRYLTLNLPGNFEVSPPPGLKNNFTDLASIVSALLQIFFYLAVFMTFFWLVWAAFQYLVARGNKEELARARGRIIWALVGLVIIIMSFTFAKYVAQIFPPQNGLPF